MQSFENIPLRPLPFPLTIGLVFGNVNLCIIPIHIQTPLPDGRLWT